MKKAKILYFLWEYPMDSQGYVRAEMESIARDYDVKVVTWKNPGTGFRSQFPYQQCATADEMIAFCQEHKPAVIHTHWMLDHLEPVYGVSRQLGIPFTVRTHSFDTLEWQLNGWFERLFKRKELLPKDIHRYVEIINDDLCLGALCFPFSIEKLRKAGIDEKKLTRCFPVSNFGKFHNRGPNGDRVLNFGATRRKKKFEDYIDLALLVRNRSFDLYPLGKQREYYAQVMEHNEKRGSPVNILAAVDPDDMPHLYKKYQWFVYTADMDSKSVGWPIAAAEAQAAGCGFCLPEIRSDVHDYLGDSAIIYKSVNDLIDIISKPVAVEMREKAFENAKKSDIEGHKHLLTDIWDRVL